MDSTVPYPNAPRVGDMQYSPPTDFSLSNRLKKHVITPSQLKYDVIDLYTVGEKDGNTATTRPFIHQVELQGTKGGLVYLKGLFDNGAMVNAICSSIFGKLSHVLGHLQPSTKTLRMADGNHVKSHGRWVGNVGLGGHTVRAAFEIFPSGKGWSLLVGKPLLQEFEAVQDYKQDTLHIPHNGSWTTLPNECGKIDTSAEHPGGAETPPSRQVQQTPLTSKESINKQNSFILYIPAEERARPKAARNVTTIASGVGLAWRRELQNDADDRDGTCKQENARPLNGGINAPPLRQVQSHNNFSALASLGDTILEDDLTYRNYKAAYRDPEYIGYRVPRILSIEQVADLPGRRNRGRRNHRNRQRRKASSQDIKDMPTNGEDEPSFLRRCWNTVWSVQETSTESDSIGDMQPEVDLGGDHSLFTRHTAPFSPKRVAEILRLVAVGPDLTDDQTTKAKNLISEFADCFALSVSEVIAIPGATHKIHIPPGVTFPKKIPHQRPLTEPQRKYLSNAIDELLAADIIEPIRPEDVKCASPITLAQKPHENAGLSLDELRYKVNMECVTHGLPSVEGIERPPPTPSPTAPPKPQTWRICQNYAALNKVTQVFPMPQGDIRTKQQRLSGHRWVHGFDFASGFYAVTIPEEYRPYLAFYVEGRGFQTQKRMPFGLTGAPSTFAYITAEKLGDVLAALALELFVDDGGMAGDDFDEMLKRTRLFFERVRATGLSLSAKKSEFFRSSMIFAGSRVSIDGVQADGAKLAAVFDWRQPPDLLNLSSFLGLTGFFRDLIKGYARLAQPLSDLLRAAAIPKNSGKAAYRTALRNVKLADCWSSTHEKAFLGLKQILTSQPVLKAPRFDGTPFIVTSDGCKDGFGAVLAQRFTDTLPNGKVVTKLHPIAFASKRTSTSEEKYKPFMLEFAALKFALDKFDDTIWGFPVEIETDCQALRDVLVSPELNATHARWRDGVVAHQIVDVRHIPGRINLVGDGISRKDEGQPRRPGDNSEWSVTPDWETARGLAYDLFTVAGAPTELHCQLRERFKNENIFIEVIDALLGIDDFSTVQDRKWAQHKAEGYLIEDGKLWRLGGVTPARAVSRRECVTKAEAIELARVEHEKTHMRRDLIKIQLLDRICSPLLDASIVKAITSCGRCKNFGSTHLHALLAPITRRRPFELLVSDYLSMQVGRGGFSKIGLYADIFTRRLFGFKFKSATGKSTVDSLRRIHQGWQAPGTFLSDGGSHFDCIEVRSFCESIGTKHHVVAAYAPWLNGLLERSNGILLNTLKRLCAPGLGEDEYERMEAKDIPRNWPDHLDTAIKQLSDRILPSSKFSPNELMFGTIVNSKDEPNPEDIHEPSESDIALHLAYADQQRLDGYSAIVDHAIKRKRAFDKRLLRRALREVVFRKGDLVQVYRSDLVHTVSTVKKLAPMWSVPRRIVNRKLNSYTLQTLDGTPLNGVFNTRRLRAFEPREGTKLALAEATRREAMDDNGELEEGEDEVEEEERIAREAETEEAENVVEEDEREMVEEDEREMVEEDERGIVGFSEENC